MGDIVSDCVADALVVFVNVKEPVPSVSEILELSVGENDIDCVRVDVFETVVVADSDFVAV